MKIILVVLLAGITSNYAAQIQVCTTPDNKLGLCMNIRDCDCMVKFLLSKDNFTLMEREFLNKYQCNFVKEPPVQICCPHNEVIVSSLDGSPKVQTPQTASIKGHRNLRLLPNDTVCGQIKADASDRIHGGNKTELLEFPWMALLSYQTNNGPDFQCGGTMISTRYILTAAHCIKPNLLGVRLGEYSIKNMTDCDIDNDDVKYCADSVQDFYVEETIIHSTYNQSHRSADDIALIRVNFDISISNSVKPICLPIEEEVIVKLYENTQFIVTGWGVTENNFPSDILLQAKVVPVNLEDCQNAYRDWMYTITENQICAQGLQGSDSCNGDSGGPIQTIVPINGKTHFVQGGIVSFGSSTCANKDIPGVYTKVEKYMNWILDNMTD